MKLKHPIISNSLYVCCVVLLLHSCGFFRCTAVQLPPSVETFSIQVYTEAADGPSDMTQNLTNELETSIMRLTTSLTSVRQDGDIHYTCIIKNFSWRTTFTRDQERSNKELQELIITLQVSYESSDEEVDNTFTNEIISKSKTSDDPAKEEANLVDEIIKELVEEICNKSLSV